MFGLLGGRRNEVRRRVFCVERCPECGTTCAQVTYSELISGSDMVSNARVVRSVGCSNRWCRYFDAAVNACHDHEILAGDGHASAD